MARRKLIENTIKDMVSGFLYYDRKEDEQLPCGAIEAAIAAGEVTEREIVDAFAAALRDGLS